MPFQWAADKTTAEYNQPLGERVSCGNYSNDCLLVGRPFFVLVTVWAASIVQACATQVVLDLAHQRLV